MSAPTGPAYVYRAEPVRVIDGDTALLEIDLGMNVRTRAMVRLMHVDTPERGHPGFEEARTFLDEWLFPLDQPAVLLVRTHKDRQSFGRWLAEVWRYDPASATMQDTAVALREAGHSE